MRLRESLCFWFIIVIVLLYISYYYITHNIPAAERGSFGDMFGAVNALFSGLAFAGMIVTLNLQRKDIESQRKDAEKQFRQNCIQQFEKTLFFLLERRDSIINNITYNPQKDTDLLSFLRSTGGVYTEKKGIDFIDFLNNRINHCNDAYNLTCYEKKVVSNYINNLHQIFKYIDDADMLQENDKGKEFENKYKYCSLVKSTLTNNELILLEYFHEDYKDNEDLWLLCRHFALLENIQQDEDDRKERNGPAYNKAEAKEYYMEYLKNRKGMKSYQHHKV